MFTKMVSKSFAQCLLTLNFGMYAIISAIGGWAINVAIDRGFIIGSAHLSPLSFPMGNAATGFFVVFSLIAGVVGAASAISETNKILLMKNGNRLSSPGSSAIIAWTLTLLAMGFACKEIELQTRNARLKTMEAFTIILSATQFIYIIVIQVCGIRN